MTYPIRWVRHALVFKTSYERRGQVDINRSYLVLMISRVHISAQRPAILTADIRGFQCFIGTIPVFSPRAWGKPRGTSFRINELRTKIWIRGLSSMKQGRDTGCHNPEGHNRHTYICLSQQFNNLPCGDVKLLVGLYVNRSSNITSCHLTP
jgi:hypothetical protein